MLNWEKCHFMVTQGIVLGNIASKKGIKVDKAKVELISNLPTPKCVKDIRSFLGHVGFYAICLPRTYPLHGHRLVRTPLINSKLC